MKRSHTISNLALAVLLCGTFLTTHLKATGSDDEGEAGSTTSSAPMATAHLPSAGRMTVETKNPRTAKQILASIRLQNLLHLTTDEQRESCAKLEPYLEGKDPEDLQSFDTFFQNFLNDLPVTITDNNNKMALLSLAVRSGKSNNELLSFVYTLKRAFPFLSDMHPNVTKGFLNFFDYDNFSFDQIKAFGTLNFERGHWSYVYHVKGKVTLNNIHILKLSSADLSIFYSLKSKTAKEIEEIGKELAPALKMFTTWKDMNDDLVFDIAKFLITLPPEGISAVFAYIERDKARFAISDNPLALVQSTWRDWREANPAEDGLSEGANELLVDQQTVQSSRSTIRKQKKNACSIQ